MDKNYTYLASKPRYEILDGLRGVAAMLVVAFHLFETYSAGPAHQIINHGYLAVDFFFVLSGFVIGYAYDDRWDRMSLSNFFKRRLVRLHPMIIMGSVLGLLYYFFGYSDGFALIDQTPWWKVLLIFVIGCTLIPVTSGMDIRGWAETYPLNGPAWSLMWEYVANILYGLVIRRFKTWMLVVFLVFSALLTVNLTMDINVFNIMQEHANYTVIGGWGIDPTQATIGLSRLLYPFFTGLLLSRLKKYITVRGGFWWCSLLIVVLMAMPRVGGADTANYWMNGLYETVCILVLFPFIVAMGAGSTVTDKRSAAVCKFLGELSYPLYITHYPLIYMQMSWAAHHPDAPVSQVVFVSVCIFVLSILNAYAAFKLYDLPVREWLKNKLWKKTVDTTPAAH